MPEAPIIRNRDSGGREKPAPGFYYPGNQDQRGAPEFRDILPPDI